MMLPMSQLCGGLGALGAHLYSGTLDNHSSLESASAAVTLWLLWLSLFLAGLAFFVSADATSVGNCARVRA